MTEIETSTLGIISRFVYSQVLKLNRQKQPNFSYKQWRLCFFLFTSSIAAWCLCWATRKSAFSCSRYPSSSSIYDKSRERSLIE